MGNNASASGSICGLLTAVFIVLKLTNYIDWSWCWVLSPLWIPCIIIIIIAVVFGLFTVLR